MSLFTSLYTGVNGMNAQSQHTATISTNIANMTTVGYKKTDTVFHDLVVNNTRPARFANGGVFADRILRADIQGALQQTRGSTQMGIVGDGFFAVKTNDDPDTEFMYTRNGSFIPDNNGVMRNAAGFILYGWPVDQNGVVTSGSTLSSLVPVDVDELNATFRPTTLGELAFNLNGAQEGINPQFLGGTLPVSSQSTWDTVTQTSIDSSTTAHFARDLTVYDNAGNPRQLTFEFRKITGPMAQATTDSNGFDYTMSLTDPIFLSGIAAGDSFTVTAGAATQEYIIGAPAGPGQVRVDTFGDLTNQLNTAFGGGSAVDAAIDSSGRLIIKTIDPTVSLTFTETNGTPLSGGTTTLNFPGLNFAPLANPAVAGAANPDQADFPAFANLATPNSNGWWEVRVLQEADPALTTPTLTDPLTGLQVPNPLFIADPGDPGTPATYRQKIELSKGLINFSSTGQLNASTDILTVASNNFDSNLAGEDITVQIDMGRFTQFAGGYNVLIQNQNGAEAGTLKGVTIDREGHAIAEFTNGEQFEIFQIPLAHFINPNGLESVTGTVFAETPDSGAVEMLEAGTGGTGIIEASTLEQSNVDLADEFANLIVSQRAFQANSRVVNTVDEMTQLLRQLKV